MEIWEDEKFSYVSELQMNLNPFFKPKLKPKLFHLNPAPERAKVNEDRGSMKVDGGRTEDEAGAECPTPPPPRAKVRQLQRPRKRPRRCDVCEKDFKSIGKMQAHR